ncbi:hypothetical protein [Mesorhizobium sp. STM 4661]|uniref:hypothetical protein n=1 Tax=Mesorhizobium sp. STM 4661 TaxID=1297570 RepID=UPI0003A37A81|nr:hypothetical protein [Mesorhizobium sp. STM 4661]
MTRVGAFDAVSKGCSIPSTLMIFAVRVVLFGRGVQHHGVERTAEKKGRCGLDERRLMPEPAFRSEYPGKNWLQRIALSARWAELVRVAKPGERGSSWAMW